MLTPGGKLRAAHSSGVAVFDLLEDGERLFGVFNGLNASHPKVLANLAKHYAYTRCSALNINGMVEAQIAVLESELLTNDTLASRTAINAEGVG